MYRIIMNDLMAWFEREQDKVLVIKGAKGVGKSWTMIDFGQGFFKRLIYVDFESDEEVRALFNKGKDIKAENLIPALSMHLDTVYEEGETFFIFDEAQLMPRAIEAIMALKAQKPELPVCITASTMGELPFEETFADKWYIQTLYPMSFEEFLTANKAQNLCKEIEKQKMEPVDPEVVKKITEYLKIFYLTGGMPIVVLDYIKNRDLNRVDAILKALLDKCSEDIAKKVPRTFSVKVPKIWESIPDQMKKDNRKFMYQYVDEKARAREYEKSVNWLVDTGYVRKVNRIKDGVAPLSSQVDEKSFELYHLDHGLLRVMCGLSHNDVIESEDPFEAINGALLEQFVLSELTMNKTVEKLYFWISGATARVEYVFEDDGEVVPVDVQSHVRRKAQSVKVFRQRYNNRMAIRISLDGLNFSKGVLNIPLYGLWNF